MLSFGVTILPDPPWQRLVELMQLAEKTGFDYGWTYDSHVLWQEPYPLLTLAAMNTERLRLGLNVTNPGTRITRAPCACICASLPAGACSFTTTVHPIPYRAQ